MKSIRAIAVAAGVSLALSAASANAVTVSGTTVADPAAPTFVPTVNGWIDGVKVDMIDTAFGWVCVNQDAFNTPEYGSLDVYLHAPADKRGEYYGNFLLDPAQWGYFKQGVNAAGYCGTDPYVSFQLTGWFSDEGYGPNTIYIYFHDKSNHLTLIGGSGLAMTKIGMNP
jgi:hypothetical protein